MPDIKDQLVSAKAAGFKNVEFVAQTDRGFRYNFLPVSIDQLIEYNGDTSDCGLLNPGWHLTPLASWLAGRQGGGRCKLVFS